MIHIHTCMQTSTHHIKYSKKRKKKVMGLKRWLSTYKCLLALAADPSLVPSTHIRCSQPPVTIAPGDLTHFSDLHRFTHTHRFTHPHIYT